MGSENKESILSEHGLKFRNSAAGEASANKFHMSNVVSIPANSQRIIVSGKVGAKDGKVPKDLNEEIDQAFKNVESSLRAAGLGEDAWQYVYKVERSVFTYHY